jgi:ankyrin repeat protein
MSTPFDATSFANVQALVFAIEEADLDRVEFIYENTPALSSLISAHRSIVSSSGFRSTSVMLDHLEGLLCKALLDAGYGTKDSCWIAAMRIHRIHEFRLIESTRRGDLEGVRRAIRDGAAVDAMDEHLHEDAGRNFDFDKMAALHHAVAAGYAEIVAELLDAGAAVDAKTVFDLETPLSIAIRKGHLKVVQLLAERGVIRNAKTDAKADVDIESDIDEVAKIILADDYPHDRAQMLEALIDGGFQPSKVRSGAFFLDMAFGAGFEDVASILCRRLSRDFRDSRGRSLLGVAASNANARMAEYLISLGFDPQDKNSTYGESALCVAAAADLDTMKVFLKAGARADGGDDDGGPLLSACDWGRLACARELIENHGVSPDSTDSFGGTGLHRAASGGHTELVRYLVSQGVDIDVQDEQGDTALHRAAEHARGESIRTLVELGAKVDLRNVAGRTPLHHCCTGVELDDGHPEIGFLVAQGADVNARDEEGRTAIHLAAGRRRMDVLVSLVSLGADVSAHDDAGETVIHRLLEKTAKDHPPDPDSTTTVMSALRSLSQLSDRVNPPFDFRTLIQTANNAGTTPLHLSASWRIPGIVEFLVDAGASVHATDNKGRTALHAALLEKYPSRDMGAIDGLLECGADPNALDLENSTPLHIAYRTGDLEGCEMLLERGASVEAYDDAGRSVIAEVAKDGDHYALSLLLPFVKQVDLVYHGGQRPIHLAVLADSPESVRMLASAGAEINVTEGRGASALEMAIHMGRAEVVKALLAAGADIEVSTSTGKSIADTARDCANPIIRSAIQAAVNKRAIEAVIGSLGDTPRASQDVHLG